MEQLKKDIASLEEYKKNMERQQLTFPVDIESMKTIRGTAFYSLGDVVPYNLMTYDESSTIKIGDRKYLIDTTQFVNILI